MFFHCLFFQFRKSPPVPRNFVVRIPHLFLFFQLHRNRLKHCDFVTISISCESCNGQKVNREKSLNISMSNDSVLSNPNVIKYCHLVVGVVSIK